eukprot:gene12521-8576_t
MLNFYTLLLWLPHFVWGLLTLTNATWVLTLVVFVVGAANIDKIQNHAAIRDAYNNLSEKLVGVPIPYIAVIVWVVVRMLFALGAQLQIELLLVLSSVTYVFRNLDRAKRKVFYDLHCRLSESKDPASILGKNLPEWVCFPSSQRVQWLNQTIASLWPSVNLATEKTMLPIMEKLLMDKKPGMVHGFKVRSFNIGSVPMVINGIQNHQYGVTETTLDIGVSWNSNMDIGLLVKIPGPDMEVYVRDMQLRATIRVTLGPHISDWPCFANMLVSILGAPEINFNIRAAKISLDAVPGLGSFLDTFIRHTMVNMMSFPKGYNYAVKPGYPLNVGFGSGVLGVLTIKLHKVVFAVKFLPYRKKKFYFKMGLVGSEAKRRKSMSYIGADSVLADKFNYTLYDTTGVIRLWTYFDVTGSDIYVGSADFVIEDLVNKPKSGLLERTLVRVGDVAQKKRGTITFSTEYHLVKSKEIPVHPPAALPSKAVTDEFLSELQESSAAPPVPRTRGAPKVSSSGGVLFVEIDRATDLPNKEKFSTSDPYVVVRVGDEVAQSDVVNSNLNPIFKFEAEMMVESMEKSLLKISIIDKNVKKDELMCTTTVELVRVTHTKDKRLAGEFKLYPQGTLMMTLTFISFT